MNPDTRRTDLARETLERYREASGRRGDPDGLRSSEKTEHGLTVYTVEVLDTHGAEIVHRPVGRYVTVETGRRMEQSAEDLRTAAEVIGAELRAMLPEAGGTVLIAGLGNRAITPDALGPKAADRVIASRHLVEQLRDTFPALRPTAVLVPGVTGNTGMESREILRGAVGQIRPSALILIDALAARRSERLCSTVQLADSGIAPGSGVGNDRKAIDRESMGIPCIAIGVPTVVDAATLAADLLTENGAGNAAAAMERQQGKSFVTVKEIDRLVEKCAEMIGLAVNLAVQPGLDAADLAMFLA